MRYSPIEAMSHFPSWYVSLMYWTTSSAFALSWMEELEPLNWKIFACVSNMNISSWLSDDRAKTTCQKPRHQLEEKYDHLLCNHYLKKIKWKERREVLKTCLFYVDNVLALTHKQSFLVFVHFSMFETRCNSTLNRYDAWFKIRKELLCFMALCFTILNSATPKSCIKFNCLDCSSTCFILS